MEKIFNCIMCPLGCELTIKVDGKDIKVSGNNCVRGITYAKNELTNPQRAISSLVKYDGGVVPVKTNGVIPKAKIKECMKELAKVSVATIDFDLRNEEISFCDEINACNSALMTTINYLRI